MGEGYKLRLITMIIWIAGHSIGIFLQKVVFSSVCTHVLRLISYNKWSSTKSIKVQVPNPILSFYVPAFILCTFLRSVCYILVCLYAHTEDLDGYADTAGNMLLYLCEERNLVLVNTEDNSQRKITYEAGRCRSSIHYSLMSRKLYTRLTRMHRDENGEFSLGSAR